MIDKVISTVKKYNMISPGSEVVVAVSGGSDSMALLHILNSIRNDFGFELKAAHVNHGIRGAAADNDEKFVESYCRDNNIPLEVLKADVIAEAKKLGVGLEEAGRKIRYEFFSRFGTNTLIATAHNLTDRTETFIFNFARGSALRGLGSIPPVRDNFIRPLIDCSKAEIETYCAEQGVPFVTDQSNSDVKYSRNRIRHNVLTELRKINPSFENSALRCIESLREDEDFLSSLADDVVSKSFYENSYDAKVLLSAAVPVRKRAAIKIVENVCGITPENKSVDEICFILENGGSRQINGGITVRVRNGMLEFPHKADSSFEPIEFSEGRFSVGNAEVVTSVLDVNEINSSQIVSNKNTICILDYDKINGKAVFRGRMAGDKITLKKRGCTKSLKKLFNELAVLPEIRDSVIVFSDEKGVLFVEGIGVDAAAEISKETRWVLKVEIKRFS